MNSEDPQTALARLSVLTPAEQAVLGQALTGVPAREIAEQLSLSEATVRSHLSSIYLKLGVSGRVALLAHFRGADVAVPSVRAVAPPRPRAMTVGGIGWAALAVLDGAYAIYLGSGALANGGSQEAWVLAIGFAILAALTAQLARAVLGRPSHRIALVSLAAAAGYLAFAIRGLFLSGPTYPFVILGVAAIAFGLLSWFATRTWRAA